jgi:hypothetical protein
MLGSCLRVGVVPDLRERLANDYSQTRRGEWEENYSPECASFIDKAMRHSRRKSRGRAVWYEVEATPEELSAVIDEVVTVWIADYEDRADYSYDPNERKRTTGDDTQVPQVRRRTYGGVTGRHRGSSPRHPQGHKTEYQTST